MCVCAWPCACACVFVIQWVSLDLLTGARLRDVFRNLGTLPVTTSLEKMSLLPLSTVNWEYSEKGGKPWTPIPCITGWPTQFCPHNHTCPEFKSATGLSCWKASVPQTGLRHSSGSYMAISSMTLPEPRREWYWCPTYSWDHSLSSYLPSISILVTVSDQSREQCQSMGINIAI